MNRSISILMTSISERHHKPEVLTPEQARDHISTALAAIMDTSKYVAGQTAEAQVSGILRGKTYVVRNGGGRALQFTRLTEVTTLVSAEIRR